MNSLSVQDSTIKHEFPKSDFTLNCLQAAMVAAIVTVIAATAIAVYVGINYTQDQYFTSETAAWVFVGSMGVAGIGVMVGVPILYILADTRRAELAKQEAQHE